MFRDENPRSRATTLSTFRLLYLRLEAHPDRSLEWKASIAGGKSLKLIRAFLEKKGIIVVLQGRGALEGTGSPTSISLNPGFNKGDFLDKYYY